MMDILIRSVARAGGIEVPDDVRIVEKFAPLPSIFKRAAAAFERWNVRRSTYLALQHLDDRMLRDIGYHRGMLHDVAGEIGRRAPANDNATPLEFIALVAPLTIAALVANDNDPSSKRCV